MIQDGLKMSSNELFDFLNYMTEDERTLSLQMPNSEKLLVRIIYTVCFTDLGVVHKWRHAVFYIFWYSLPPSSCFLVQRLKYCCHKILDTPSALRPWRHLWMAPYSNSILSLGQFLILPQRALNMMLSIKVVKIDSKIIISLYWSKSAKQIILWQITKKLDRNWHK